MTRQAKETRPGPYALQRQKLVEEYIKLDQEIDLLKPRMLRHQKLREIILAWFPTLEPEEQAEAAGQSADLIISARDKLRSVTPKGKQALFRLWGPKEFLVRAVVQLKNLPDPKDPDGLYTAEALAGPRHLHVVAKPAAVKAAKSAVAAA